MRSPQPVFRALADPTRRAIVAMLAERPMTIAEVASNFDVSRPAVVGSLTWKCDCSRSKCSRNSLN